MEVTRTAWDDWYADGDRSAVFVGGHVLVLSELATAALQVVDGATAADDVAAHLESLFGAPEGVDLLAATEATLRELVERGVLAEADGSVEAEGPGEEP